MTQPMHAGTRFLLLIAVVLVGCVAPPRGVLRPGTLDALRAFDAFSRGESTGDFDAFFDLLADEVEYSAGSASDAEVLTGYVGRGRLVDRCRDIARSPRDGAVRVTSIIGDERGAVVEFEHGTAPVSRRAIAIETVGGRVTSFREYVSP